MLHLAHLIHTAPPPSVIYTLSLHDALPISRSSSSWSARGSRLPSPGRASCGCGMRKQAARREGIMLSRLAVAACASRARSEEHTSELQSQFHLVCRLLLEKKKKSQHQSTNL